MSTSDTVPFIDLGPYVNLVRGTVGSSFAYHDVMHLLDTHEFIGGGETTKRFETALAAKLDANHAVACANGTDALVLALRACGIDRGHRVAIPNLTFWATYEAICAVGATPVLIDVDPDDLQMCFKEFVAAHNRRRFDAAILVHLYGWCSARLVEFRSLCRNRRITLVEDAAQAFGVIHKVSAEASSESVFADADIATLSFHPAKVIGGIGDGGAVLCKNARTAARVRLLANHGRTGHYNHVVAGTNSRMDAIQAAWLLRALEVSDEVITKRSVMAARYYNDGTVSRRQGRTLGGPLGVASNGYLNVTLTENPEHRDEIRAKLAGAGVHYGTVYPTTIADQEGAGGAIVLGELPVSRRVARTIINLPLFYGITDAQIDRVLEALK